MDRESVKAFLRRGNYKNLGDRINSLNMMGIHARLEYKGTDHSRVEIENGAVNVWDHSKVRRNVHQENPNRPYGKTHRRVGR